MHLSIQIKIRIYFYAFILLLNNLSCELISNIKTIGNIYNITNAYEYVILYVYNNNINITNKDIKKSHLSVIASLEEVLLSNKVPLGKPIKIVKININDTNNGINNFIKLYEINHDLSLLFFYRGALMEKITVKGTVNAKDINDEIYNIFADKKIKKYGKNGKKIFYKARNNDLNFSNYIETKNFYNDEDLYKNNQENPNFIYNLYWGSNYYDWNIYRPYSRFGNTPAWPYGGVCGNYLNGNGCDGYLGTEICMALN